MAILQKEIDKLKKSILFVGTLVEENFVCAIESINNNDIDSAQEVINKDKEIDLKEIEVEEECLKILALHQPVAIDLRFIIAVLKINNDLERIGDLSCNIAERVITLSKLPQISIPEEIPKMAEIVQQMLKDSLDSLVELDITLAQKVCADDDKVDNLHREMYPFVESKIEEEPDKKTQWIQLLGISRYLERSADHCTNIAEDVEYLINGVIHRHSSKID